MQTLRRIVIGTDFSACAEQALETAITLAKVALAGVIVVHVCKPDDDDLDEALRERSEALTRLVDSHQHRGIEVMGVLRSGKPWVKLNNVAAEVGANMIVIGRYGSGSGRDLAIGSVAEHLVRSASRPILVVPCDFVHAPGAR